MYNSVRNWINFSDMHDTQISPEEQKILRFQSKRITNQEKQYLRRNILKKLLENVTKLESQNVVAAKFRLKF